MSTEQGVQNTIPISADIKKAEELALNRVSLLEEDGRRLTKFKQELEKSCTSVKQDESDTQKRVDVLTLQESQLKTSIENLAQAEIEASKKTDEAVQRRKDAEKEEEAIFASIEGKLITSAELDGKNAALKAWHDGADAKKSARELAVTSAVAVLEDLKTKF